jgi:hypothetical protein
MNVVVSVVIDVIVVVALVFVRVFDAFVVVSVHFQHNFSC